LSVPLIHHLPTNASSPLRPQPPSTTLLPYTTLFRSRELPNYQVPGFDGIGANEYIVDVTHPDAVDFISTMDTPYLWELNIWYHTLNVGFRTRISGETDFPCITDARVGQGRIYAKVDGPLSYSGWL